VTQSALAAFDVACWDLMGQSLGVPVWKLLGGKFRERVPAYANGWYQAEREAGAIADLARKVVARGYRALKLDPFGAASAELPGEDRRRAVSIVAAVRDAVGPDVQILIEMHGRFTPATAGARGGDARTVRSRMDRGAGAAGKRRGARARQGGDAHPIATGERAHTIADIREFVETGVADVVQVDLTHFGGFLPMKHLAGWADAHYLLLAPHNVCGPVGTMANVHFAIRDAELQGPRALQRLRRPVGVRPGRPRATRCVRGWLLRAARSSRPRRTAEPRRLRGASSRRADGSSCSKTAGRNEGRPGDRRRGRARSPQTKPSLRA
jgi:galactonate dehydratase